MTARAEYEAARAAVVPHPPGKLAVTRALARIASVSERSRPQSGAATAGGAIVAPAGIQAAGRTYGDVLDAEPIEPFAERERTRAERRRAMKDARRNDAGAPLHLRPPEHLSLERDQLRTSCSIGAVELDESGTVLAEQLADDPRAHYFRRDVGRYLEPYWPRRARALVSCGEAGARCDCGECGARHVLPYRCGARSCPTCAHSMQAIVCEKISRKAEAAAALLAEWDGPGERPTGWQAPAWRMLTLTTVALATAVERYEPDALRRYIKAVRGAWGKFWRSLSWGRRVHDVSTVGRPTKRARRDTLFAIGIEVAPGGMVHLHAAIYGERIEVEALADAWKAACPVGGFAFITMMKDARGAYLTRETAAAGFRDALREVLKYVSKGDKDPGRRAERAAAVEYALRGVRRVEIGGALRMVPKVTEKDVATEARECDVCGTAGRWRWRGVRAPSYVRNNGGFGVSHIVDEDDAAHLTNDDRELAYRRDAGQRETWRDQEREKRPGGAFYGGSPPPWWNDEAEEGEKTLTSERAHALRVELRAWS